VRAQNEARRAELERGVQADPLVKAVLARFPGAQIVAVREGEQELPPASPEGDVMPPEPPIDDDSSVFAEQIGPDDIREDD
jgi:DNA polymerase-3 subunit gamma/tau